MRGVSSESGSRSASSAGGLVEGLHHHQTPSVRLRGEVHDQEPGQHKQQCRTVNHGPWLSSSDVVGTKSMLRPRTSHDGAAPLKYREPP